MTVSTASPVHSVSRREVEHGSEPAHRHRHGAPHVHAEAAADDAALPHHHPRHHAHGPEHRHPPARPGFSLLRLSAWQRLAIALPLAALIWALALAVIAGGGA